MSEFIHIDPADMLIVNRMAQRYAKINGRGRAAQKAAKEIVKGDLSLDGWAILYDQPLVYEDEIWVFEAGCFSHSINAGSEIYFEMDHDENQRLASTRNALTFVDDETGLAFRLDLDGVRNGPELKRMVDTGRRAAISVGIKNEETHIRMFGKHPVRMITKSELVEISLVGDGKCRDAFAGVVNSTVEPLKHGKKGAMFIVNFTAHKLKRIKQAVSERSESVRAVASRFDRIEGKVPAVSKAESNVDKWYRARDAKFDVEHPKIAKWYRAWNAAA